MVIEIPIYNLHNGQTVATARWSGGLYDGTLTYRAERGSEDAVRRIARIAAIRTDLKAMRFRSFGPRLTVAGWQGVEGSHAALRIMLPAIGLRIGSVDLPSVFDGVFPVRAAVVSTTL